MPRLTKEVRQKILDQNEGFQKRTYQEGRNFEEERIYTVSGGKLHIREIGNTSWSDSRYDNDRIADEDETHRFWYKYSHEMNLDGIE